MRRLGAWLVVALLSLGPTVRSENIPVDLELVLAIDVSDSIDTREAGLQRQGYVAAFARPEVIGAIASGVHRRIALTYFEWAEASHQRVLVDWMLIAGERDAEEFAQRLFEAPTAPGRWTAIGAALAFGAARFNGNGFDGTRKVIDISGDGSNNDGPDPSEIRKAVVAAGVTINGLPIVGQRLSALGWPRSADVDDYYEKNVIGGAGAFLLPVDSFEGFADAIARKLTREIAAAPAPARYALVQE